MLYKFQRPLFSTGTPKILVYNEDRSHMAEINMVQSEVEHLFAKDEYKVFWHARKNKEGKLVMEKKVPESRWPSW